MTRSSKIEHSQKPTNGTQRPVDDHRPNIGLGIDAGGTYTDVVVLDFGDSSILAKSKALTTKWDYTEGIEAALEKIPSHYLEDVGLVSVSTTLATNAIVENHGQRVGVLLMPPYGQFAERDLAHTPTAVVHGQIDMDGTVLEPIDPLQIEAVAKAMVRDYGVKAFAVSGSGATINAGHENEVMKILQDTTGLGVTCGHMLSDMLGVYQRAATAIFNARVVPYIEAFLRHLRAALRKRDIDAPVMVVKGDGALMSAEMARERPVETIFSGPAASVAGARKLTNLTHALVVDIGGTTTDIAAIANSRVEVCRRGSVIADAHTHVRALNMRTKGLGGDSAITIQRGDICIGPKRVTPVSLLASQFPDTSHALDFIEREIDPDRINTETIQLLALTNHKESIALEPVEKRILEVLAQRPYSIEEIAQVLELPYRGIATFSKLISHNAVSLSTLTPTDLLHAEGRVRLWDSDAARRVCRVFAGSMNLDYAEFVKQSLDVFTRELALELLRKLLDDEVESKLIDSSLASQAILRKWLQPTDNNLAVSMKLPYPIIGVGAPAGELLPAAARLFHTDCTIPRDFDVANAIGAITSAISVSRTIKIARKESGRFAIWGLADGREFDELQEAVDSGKAQVTQEVLALANRSGILNPKIETSIADDTVVNGYGVEVSLGTIVTASVIGKPEIRRATYAPRGDEALGISTAP